MTLSCTQERYSKSSHNRSDLRASSKNVLWLSKIIPAEKTPVFWHYPYPCSANLHLPENSEE